MTFFKFNFTPGGTRGTASDAFFIFYLPSCTNLYFDCFCSFFFLWNKKKKKMFISFVCPPNLSCCFNLCEGESCIILPNAIWGNMNIQKSRYYVNHKQYLGKRNILGFQNMQNNLIYPLALGIKACNQIQ